MHLIARLITEYRNEIRTLHVNFNLEYTAFIDYFLSVFKQVRQQNRIVKMFLWINLLSIINLQYTFG